MSDAHSSSTLLITGGDRPVQEPDAVCEGCGAQGTVGRASRQDAGGAGLEEHRFCADCWPEWSAFYRARWLEQRRRAAIAWHDRLRDAEQTSPPPGGGAWFESATWHGVVDYVQKLTVQARYYREPPSPETLARSAAAIRAAASEKVGPMPPEVRAFLAEFGQGSSDAPASE
ncbi:MAG TPA: hypothetical protein VK636_13210 [Gemmatimonadaceae bacterium]|nr:hypothetical protein [Gemmatimonadaceae bacterium]